MGFHGERLATYGTLGPGRVNHHHVAGIRGTWASGSVHGHRVESGWGSALGFPGITLDPDGPVVRVDVLTSDELADHWPRLDEFEGEAYERVPVTVALDDGSSVEAYIYALVPEPGGA